MCHNNLRWLDDTCFTDTFKYAPEGSEFIYALCNLRLTGGEIIFKCIVWENRVFETFVPR